jgi:hypothetical protein
MNLFILCSKLLIAGEIRNSTTNSKLDGYAERVWMFNDTELKTYTSNAIISTVPEILDTIQSLKHD